MRRCSIVFGVDVAYISSGSFAESFQAITYANRDISARYNIRNFLFPQYKWRWS